jgi:Bacteriophage HK97-gp10, putative tail-component
MGNFQADYRGIGEMLRSDFIEADMVERAFKVLARAEATAPFDAKDRDGFHYRDAFHVESGRRGGARHDRAYASVVNTNDVALFVEYGGDWIDKGGGRTPRHRTLGKALDAAAD